MIASAFIRSILADPCNPIPRLVYADWLEENGETSLAELIRSSPELSFLPTSLPGVGGDGNGDGGMIGDGVTFTVPTGHGDAGGDSAYAVDLNGWGDGSSNDGDVMDGAETGDPAGRSDAPYSPTPQQTEIIMNDGFYILSVKSGFNPYVMIGDVEVNGFKVTVRNARVIRRFGSRAMLSVLAVRGPQSDTHLLDPSPVEYLYLPDISRWIPADRSKWALWVGAAGDVPSRLND